MDYDAIIIGAGMSGLGAGVRLAYFQKRVCIIEQHTTFGGLNSFYTIGGRPFDVGLHALTNFAPPAARHAPLNRLLRQLRIPRRSLDLCEQRYSKVCFPGRTLQFDNDPQRLIDSIDAEFPGDTDGFLRLVETVRSWDDLQSAPAPRSARQVLAAHLGDRTLIDMLLCPLMFYGSAQAGDMDWTLFVTLFKSVYLEGLARPRQGVRRIVAELVKRYRACGGRLRMGCGVRALACDGRRVRRVVLEDGTALGAATVLSCAGLHETLRLCEGGPPPPDCGAPGHEGMREGVLRLACLARCDRWTSLAADDYARAKQEAADCLADRAARFVPGFQAHVVDRDVFTPRTIVHYTRHLNGAVYGSPCKRRDGRTHLENLFLCGTDQGFCGVIGALVSGIWMANVHVLSS